VEWNRRTDTKRRCEEKIVIINYYMKQSMDVGMDVGMLVKVQQTMEHGGQLNRLIHHFGSSDKARNRIVYQSRLRIHDNMNIRQERKQDS